MDLAKIVRIVLALAVILGLIAGAAAVLSMFQETGGVASGLVKGNLTFTRSGFSSHDELRPMTLATSVLQAVGLDLRVFSLIGGALIGLALLLVGWQLFLRVFGQ